MAETRPNNRIISSEMAIPSGLNRIRTRRPPVKEKPSSIPDDLRPPVRPKLKKKNLPHGHGETSDSSRKVERGRTKIAKWFSSYIPRSSPQASNDVMRSEDAIIGYKTNHTGETTKTVLGHESNQFNGNQALVDGESSGKAAKSFKSFSDELGPKGGIQSSYPRFHSYDNLKELLGSLHSRFDSAKDVVNVELTCLLEDIMNVGDTIDPSVESRTMAEDLIIVAERCIEMTSFQFRLKCESIVQDLTEKRQKCQGSLVKWFYTRMLFILTRCTRLLQFQKGNEQIDENSLSRFKQCLESIPAIDSSCLPRGTVDFHAFGMHGEPEVEHNCTKEDQVVSSIAAWASFLVPTKQIGINATEDLFSARNETTSQASQFGLVISQDQPDDNYLGKCMRDRSFSLFSNHEHLDSSLVKPEGVRTVEASEPVICRICEEVVPVSHLESHSYICAYADKCVSNCIDIDECFLKIEEILEQIIESRDASSHQSLASPENSRLQNLCSAITSEGCSPKVSEWRNKGLEGMFEDIHDMDTASIEDSHISPVDLKGYLNMRLGNHGPSSSTGSLTSVSSTNTPRAGQFDSFWLEHNNPSELEDAQQMIDLADVARCVAGTDISKDGSHDFLLACMHDLQDILRHSKLKALVVDTFGGRIEKLLREKYILACEAMNVKIPSSNQEGKENSRLTSDNMAQSCSLSTPLVSHKERTSIDDFEIIKPISRGAFGKVFLARKRVTGDLFAIKVLKKLDMIRKNDIERILAERNILITVRNPFVVRFFYSFTCRENLYLVMEYLNGGDLFSLLRTLGCLGEEVARTYVAELVLALEYLHSLGIVHRDLKPDNILIAHDGHIKIFKAASDYEHSFEKSFCDKLTDFGLSRIGLVNNTVDLSGQERIDDSAVHTLVVEDGDGRQRSAVGTPDYLAPEILLGTEHGYAVDWWSVGIILFELLTGVPPFSNEQPEIIFDNILNGKILWPSIPNQMSFQAQDLINRLLIHDPTMRLGANGAPEVKAHTFFSGVNWENLALQKLFASVTADIDKRDMAAFVPEPDSADDTSYFVSRFAGSSGHNPDCHDCSSSDTDVSRSSTNSVAEADECGDFEEFDPSPLNLSMINFSFKNLSQLASMNHDVLLQTGQDSTKEQAK